MLCKDFHILITRGKNHCGLKFENQRVPNDRPNQQNSCTNSVAVTPPEKHWSEASLMPARLKVKAKQSGKERMM